MPHRHRDARAAGRCRALVLALALTTDAQGGIGGVNCAGHTFTVAFSSATTAYISSPAFTAYTCTSAFEAEFSGITANSAGVAVWIYQECTPGIVCADYYTGTMSR